MITASHDICTLKGLARQARNFSIPTETKPIKFFNVPTTFYIRTRTFFIVQIHINGVPSVSKPFY